MIVAATNEALRKASETMEQKMGGITSGLGLPAGFGF
jgi:DNA-binding protein YbaB